MDRADELTPEVIMLAMSVDPEGFIGVRVKDLFKLYTDHAMLLTAVKEHHKQRAHDRCWLDDDRGAPGTAHSCGASLPCRRRECLEQAGQPPDRCTQGGKWPTYRELEVALATKKFDFDVISTREAIRSEMIREHLAGECGKK